MRKQLAFITALMALTLGVGIFAGARQSTDSHGVDAALEEARQHVKADSDDMPALREKPHVTLHYPATDPADGHPILRWSRVDGAVMYDVQILKKEEEKGDDGKVSTSYEPFMDDQKAYTTGLELDLPDTFLGQVFYWRVRGLDLKGRPVSEFSDIEEAHVDIFQPFTEKPTPLSFFNQGPGQTLLYPVYDWIAVPGAAKYEVEILNDLPEDPNGTAPSIHRIDSYTPQYAQQYDQKARMGDKPFYWRVLALDGAGNPIGGYSDALPFELDPAAEQASSLSLATVSATVVAVFPIRRRIGTSVTLRISCSRRSTWPRAAIRVPWASNASTATSCPSSRRMSSSSSAPTASAPAYRPVKSSVTYRR